METLLTRKEEILDCKHGVYRIHWRDGSSSVASIGGMHNGNRWVAPSNWTSKDSPTGLLKDHIESIALMVLITTK